MKASSVPPKTSVYLLVLVCWFQWLCTRVFCYLCNPIFSTFVGVIYTWGEVIYAPLVGVCITPTVYVWKLDMLVSKNVVVSTCKVLFVNLVLCWRAVSWGQNPSCNFTLDHISWFVFLLLFREMIFVISTFWKWLKRLGEQGASDNKWQPSLCCLIVIFAHVKK